MIELKNISKSFGNLIAVNKLNLTINDGEIFGLLGPNGAGKSTSLKMITGILSPSEGEIFIDGFSMQKEPTKAKMLNGFVPDSPDMFLGMTGADYLSFIASVYNLNLNIAKEEGIELAKEFNLYDDLNNYIVNYSHGMRQKIFLIGSLLHNPKNWILDEPLTGLDPEAAFNIKEKMKDIAHSNKAVLFSTHVLDVAEKVCDRIGIISKGKLAFVGTLDELRNLQHEQDKSLEALFLELTKE